MEVGSQRNQEEKASIYLIYYVFKLTKTLCGQFLVSLRSLFVSLFLTFVCIFEIIRCIVKSLITTSTYFFCNTNEKRKLEKSFLDARVWVSKSVHQSPK